MMPKPFTNEELEKLIQQIQEQTRKAVFVSNLVKKRWGRTPGEMIDATRRISTPPPGVPDTPGFRALSAITYPIRAFLEQTTPGQAIMRLGERMGDVATFYPREAYGQEYTPVEGHPGVERAMDVLGQILGYIAPIPGVGIVPGAELGVFGLAQKIAEKAGEAGTVALSRIAPEAAKAITGGAAALPSILRTAGRAAATGAAYSGLQRAFLPEGYRPTAEDIAANIAFFGGAGVGGHLASQAVKAALPGVHPLIEAPIRGTAAGIAGTAAQYPFQEKRGTEYLKDMATTAASMAVFSTLSTLISPPNERADFLEKIKQAQKAMGRYADSLKANKTAEMNKAYQEFWRNVNAAYNIGRRQGIFVESRMPEEMRQHLQNVLRSAARSGIILEGTGQEVPTQQPPARPAAQPTPAPQAPETPVVPPQKPIGKAAEAPAPQPKAVMTVMPGDTVYTKTGKAFTVVSAESPISLRVKNEQGKLLFISRKMVSTKPPEQPKVEVKAPEAQEAPQTRQEAVQAPVEAPKVETPSMQIEKPSEGEHFPIPLENIPLIRYQKEPGKATYSKVRGGIWYNWIDKIHGEDTGYQRSGKTTGGMEKIREIWTPRNPLLIVDTLSNAGDGAIKRLRGEDYLDQIYAAFGDKERMTAILREVGVPESDIPAVLQHPDQPQVILDRIGTELARKAGYDSIIVSTPNGLYGEIVKLYPEQAQEAKPIESVQIEKSSEGKIEAPEVVPKPYEGLTPGTPEWMRVWQEHPELQREMLEYAKKAREVVVPTEPTAKPVSEMVPFVTGKTATVKTERGTAVDTQYAIVDADSLISSHDTALRPDPRFPSELQPRERTRAASEVQITRIANQLEPEFLAESPKASEGAPIVGKDMIVESGNARVIAIKKAYEEGLPTGENYRKWLIENADRFGIDRSAIEGIKNPVLVRVRQTDVDRQQFVREANEAPTAAMSATEQALSDAKKLSGSLMQMFVPNEEGEISNVANREFIRGFMQEVVGPTEQGRYMTADGALSQEGVRRIQNAIFAKAYGDPSAIEKLAESTDNNVRNITGAMLIAAPRYADMKERIEQGRLHNLDISSELSAAMNKLSELRERGEPVERYLEQRSMFAEQDLDPITKKLLWALSNYSKSRKKLAEFLGAYVDVVNAAGDPKQLTLFQGVKAPTKEEALEAALNVMEARYERPDQATLFDNKAIGGKAFGEPGPAAGPGETVTAKTGAEEDILKKTVDKLNNDLALKRAAEEKYGAPGIINQLGGQIQFIKDVIDEVRKKRSVKLSDADVERVLSATKAPRTAIEQAKESLRKIGEGIKDIFVYEWRVQDYPKFVDELRRFQGITRDAQVSALNTYKAIVGHLDTPQEFEIFRKLIFLRDFKAGLEAGEPVPGDLTPEQVDKAIQELEAKANDNVKRALDAHDKVFEAAWEELKRRGKVDPEAEGREHYVPHRVLDYIRDQTYQFPAIGRRFKAPYRYYLRERKGSTRLIDTDYAGITMNHLAKLYIDNATDDFAQQIAAEYDIYPKLSKAQQEKIGKPVPNRLYEIDGKRYLGWQYEPGRQIYPASSVYEETVLDLIEQVAQEGVSPEKARELLAKEIKEVPAIGRHKKTYLLPEEIAYRLIRLKEPRLNYHILEAVRGLLTWWKSQVLGPLGAGIPFQVGNFIGDTLNLYREDPAAILLLGEGWKAASEWQKNLVSPKYKKLIEVAEKTRVVEAGLMRKGGLPYDPMLAKLEPIRYLLRGINPGEWYRNISERRELSVRLAKLLADLRRIEQGKMPVAKYEDVQKLKEAGLTEEEIAGKIAREFTVDYNKQTPEGKGILRDLLFPFVQFYLENFKNWFNYVKRNPGNFLVKFLAPLGALALYNWLKFPEEERKLPLYYRVMPHLITGYKTPEGKPIIIAMQTPVDQAAKMIGLEIVQDLARQVLTGEKGIDEASKELAVHVMGAIPRAMWDLFNPFFKAPIEAAMNRNTFTDSPIVPERLKGTPEGKKMLIEYVVQQWLAPVAQYMRATRQPEPEEGMLKWLAQGPADLKRAVGIREVDTVREAFNRFYDRLEEFEAKDREWKLKKERGEVQGDPPFAEELHTLRSDADFLAEKRKQIRMVQNNNNYTSQQKKQIIRGIEQEMFNRIAWVINGQPAPIRPRKRRSGISIPSIPSIPSMRMPQIKIPKL